MKTASWLALVVLAGVIGFVLGRGEPRSGPGPVAGGASTAAPRSALPPKADDRSPQQTGHLARQRGETAEAFVLRMLGAREGDISDPFVDSGLEGMDLNRTVAAIFQMPAEAFPAVLEHARAVQAPDEAPDDPFADPAAGYDYEVLSPMLARWTDLEPRAAMAWVRAANLSPDEPDMDHYKDLICRETLRTDPELALRFLKDMVTERNSPEVLAAPQDFAPTDPFAPSDPGRESFVSASADSFFELLCREHPELAVEAYAGAGTALQFDGAEGWVEGVVANGLAQRALEFAATLGGEAGAALQRDLAYRLGQVDPVRVEEWLEGRSGEDYKYVQRQVMEAKFAADPGKAASWYLERSSSAEDRADRVSELAARQGSVAASTAWLERMEAAGEDTGEAWVRMVGRLEPANAWPLLDRVPAGRRPDLERSLFRKSAEDVYLRFGSSSESLLEPKPDQLAAIRAQGREEEFQAFLREHNARVAAQALEFLQEKGLVELE